MTKTFLPHSSIMIVRAGVTLISVKPVYQVEMEFFVSLKKDHNLGTSLDSRRIVYILEFIILNCEPQPTFSLLDIFLF